MSSILPKSVGDHSQIAAPEPHNHPQPKERDIVRTLFRQIHQCRSFTKTSSDLCRIESELEKYVDTLTLEIQNTRKNCQNQVEVLQKSIDDLRSVLSQVEDLFSESGRGDSVSILGSVKYTQLGCFYRSDEPGELQRHSETGIHYRLQLQDFAVVQGNVVEAISAPKSTSDMESCQIVVAANIQTSMKSSALLRGKFSLHLPFPPISQWQCFVLTEAEPGPRALRYQCPNQNDERNLVHCEDIRLDERCLNRKDAARFECPDCSKRFTRSHTLVEHRRAHNGERPFGCNSCPKRFARPKDRNRHQKLHSGEKIFICKGILDTGVVLGCHSRFAREDGLLSHLRSTSAFECLEPLLDVAAEHIFSLTNTMSEEPQYCPKPPTGCGLGFQDLKDFKEHYNSEAGKACVRSRLVAFALPFFDHRRLGDKSRRMSIISSPLRLRAPHSAAREALKLTNLPPFTAKTSSIPVRTHSKDSPRIPLLEDAGRFDAAQENLTRIPREVMHPARSIGMYQKTTTSREYHPTNGSFGEAGFEGFRDDGLRIAGYTPTRGKEGDVLQVKVGSSVPLHCAVFNVQIGFFADPEPQVQNMNAILASVEEKRISPKSFYSYIVSARVPHPENQPRLSPLPIKLEINGMQRLGGRMFEVIEVGLFTYEE
jgi:Zinc finger, C2H2 type